MTSVRLAEVLVEAGPVVDDRDVRTPALDRWAYHSGVEKLHQLTMAASGSIDVEGVVRPRRRPRPGGWRRPLRSALGTSSSVGTTSAHGERSPRS